MSDWQYELFGCFGDIKVLVCTWCIPCYVFGRTAEKVGENCLMCGLVTVVPLLNLFCMAQVRGKVRDQKSIDGSFLQDLLCSFCCGGCALCQMAREVSALDMAQSMARE